MNELPLFISYRQDDGMPYARWLRNSLVGKTIFARDGTVDAPRTISVYFDQTVPPVEDWLHLLDKELSRSAALIIVCTHAAAVRFEDGVDYMLREVEWWAEKRHSISPILITPHGAKYIPRLVQEHWPKAQFINIPPFRNEDDFEEGQAPVYIGAIKRILQGVELRARGIYSDGGTCSFLLDEHGLSNSPGFYSWEKDKNFRYVGCNENYARAAGLDSAKAICGKSDDDMPWRSLADVFRRGDQQVMDCESPARVQVEEIEIMVDRVANILVTETQMLTANGSCVGVSGFFLDISGKRLVSCEEALEMTGEVNLGPEFDDVTFSKTEAKVFFELLGKHNAERISAKLGIRRIAVEAHIRAIMLKLQCKTLGDVLIIAHRTGLPFRLFGRQYELNAENSKSHED